MGLSRKFTLNPYDVMAAVLALDGAGSGLDADKVDGKEASDLALLNHTHTALQITDFDTEVSNNSSVAANTAHISDVFKHIPFLEAVAYDTNLYGVVLPEYTEYNDGFTLMVKFPQSIYSGDLFQINYMGYYAIEISSARAYPPEYTYPTGKLLAVAGQWCLLTKAWNKFLLNSPKHSDVDLYLPQTLYDKTLVSPALTDMPTAPTAAADTETTQIASTAFVLGQAGTDTPLMDGTATAGTSKRYARIDHKHPIDTSRASASSLSSHESNPMRHLSSFGSAGSANTYTATATGWGYVDGNLLVMRFNAANTGAATLNVNNQGPKQILKHDGSPLSGGEISAGASFLLKYDMTFGGGSFVVLTL